MTVQAAFFDLDRTLIDVNSGHLWLAAEWRAGRLGVVTTLRAGWWLTRYAMGEADLDAALDHAARVYTGLPVAEMEARVAAWVEQYRQRLVDTGAAVVGPDAFLRAFDLMGLQRHIKVLGIFCRLWYRDGKAGYLQDLPLVWQYTRDVGRRHPETAPLVALMERVIGDHDLTMPRA